MGKRRGSIIAEVEESEEIGMDRCKRKITAQTEEAEKSAQREEKSAGTLKGKNWGRV